MTPRPRTVPRGTGAATRRRERRSARADAPGVSKAPGTDPTEALTAAASGSTSLPLSDRNASWDAAAAAKSLDPAQYAKAFFWRDPEGDPETLAAYKLGFATAAGGTLTAVWKGVTAAAGAVQGARGGVAIPDADVAGVKAKIGSYYAKAAKQFEDPNIKVPWDAGEASADDMEAFAETVVRFGLDARTLAACKALAYAEHGLQSQVVPSDGGGTTYYFEVGGYAERLAYWAEAFQHSTRCECGHAVSEHIGADGPCKHEDGRGTCSCGGFAELQAEESAQQSQTLKLTFEFDPATRDRLIATAAADQADLAHALTDEVKAGRVRLAEALEVALPDAHQPGETLPEMRPGPAAPEESATPAWGSAIEWAGTITLEGTLTDDGRAFAPGSISWRDLPLSLGAMLDTPHADVVTESRVCGRIDAIWRDGDLIRATGIFDDGEFGQEIARMVGDGTLRGVSVDIAVHQFEVGPKDDYFDGDGRWIAERPETAGEGDLLERLYGDSIFVITDGVIGATTVCPFPAFADARIAVAASLVAGSNPAIWTSSMQAGWTVVARAREGGPLTASAAGLAPVEPPSGWFTDPALDGPTPLTIDEDGRVYGHAALWDVCHIGIPGVCTTAPRTASDYAYFLLKEVLCTDGARAQVGTITLDTDHADRRLGRVEATAHYDNTGTAVADVAAGEDEHGIWVAGALRPDVDAEKARKLSGAALSGDWRNMDGSLELVALLAVNVPGFPVPRTRALVAAGEDGNQVLALVAAGVNAPRDLTPDEALRAMGDLVARAKGEPTQDQFAALAARARGGAA